MKYLLTVLSLLMINIAQAQTSPEIILTWKANSYTPASYMGKTLPSIGSRVDVALEALSAGRVIDLSRIKITWTIDGELHSSGIGQKSIFFTTDGLKGDPAVSASFLYKGQTLSRQISIPLARPEVVIVGGPNIFKALLYFFNFGAPTQAKFTWTVNGISTEGTGQNPDILAISGNIPSGSDIGIRVSAQNLLKNLEIASGSLNFTK